MDMTGRITRAAALAAVVASCAGADRASLVTFRDSAGIMIAENAQGAATAAATWSLADTASLSIGVLEGDSAHQLFRVGGAARLGDGRIAILNSGSRELRFFGPDGRHLRSVGRDGEGPGEFRRPLPLVHLAGDSLLVWDERLQRFSVFDDEGTFIRFARIDRPVHNPFLAGVFDDGSVVIGDHVLQVPASGFAPTFAHFVRYAPAGTFSDSIGSFPWMEIGIIGEAGSGILGGRTFSARTSVALRGERFWVGTGAGPEVNAYDTGGRWIRSVRWDGGERAVNASDVERYYEEEYSDMPPERRRDFEAIGAVDRFPAYEELGSDRAGNLWVKEYSRPGATGPDRWLVFDPDGALVAHIAIPDSLQLFEVGDDWALALVRDELDVERVALYRLRKPA
jgi:hypothetical protein